MSEKSILEQALLQVNTLEEAVKQNAKGILASTMKQELNDLLKESLEEEEEVANEEEAMDPKEEEVKDMPAEEEGDDSDEEDDATDAEDDSDLDNDEPAKDVDSMDADSEDEMSSDDEFSMDKASDMEDDDDVMDMTGASDEEVLKVFKAMKPEDGIVVKKDGNKVELETGDDEYIIKLGEEDEAMEEEANEEWNEEAPVAEEDSMEEENLYEIELDEEEDEEVKEEESMEETESMEEEDSMEEDINEGALKGLNKAVKKEPKESALPGLKAKGGKKSEAKESALPGLKAKGGKKAEAKEEALKGLKSPKKVEPKEEDEDVKKEEATEAVHTKWNPHGGERAGLKSKKVFKAGSNHGGALNEEVENLKKQNEEYKKALVLFKDKLNEVAVFNANLAYATRLFTEHSTTKQEKLNILKRFDSISTLSESKNLYSAIKSELETKTPVTESVVDKITSAPSTSSSQEVLAESKAYENPQFKRMKDLMSKIK